MYDIGYFNLLSRVDKIQEICREHGLKRIELYHGRLIKRLRDEIGLDVSKSGFKIDDVDIAYELDLEISKLEDKIKYLDQIRVDLSKLKEGLKDKKKRIKILELEIDKINSYLNNKVSYKQEQNEWYILDGDIVVSKIDIDSEVIGASVLDPIVKKLYREIKEECSVNYYGEILDRCKLSEPYIL